MPIRCTRTIPAPLAFTLSGCPSGSAHIGFVVRGAGRYFWITLVVYSEIMILCLDELRTGCWCCYSTDTATAARTGGMVATNLIVQ